ncbi:MAG TPA: FAD-dependent oxidoreductase [Pseudolabrys sp.]|nr:FAD-dependent oxidoreductase [Pseudolabrys sp.]
MGFVVVGAGLAGHRAAIELRKLVPAADIVLLGEEPGLPYDRPPLSKAFLVAPEAPAPMLGDANRYSELGIDYRPETRAVAIDRTGKTVRTEAGQAIPYERLLLATGSRVRTLAPELVGDAPVHVLRTLADAERLRAELTAGRRVTVIGGGLIGLEIAAAARMKGCVVTVVERERRLLSRGLPASVGDWVCKLHQRQGANIMLPAEITSIRRADDGIDIGVGGTRHMTDVVVLGIGITPNCELAASAGLDVDDGIRVDRSCRTSDPNIFAAGEVTAHPIAGIGPQRRIESWKVASEQAVIAARAMAGDEATFEEIPWFWSDQYDVNIQALGQPDAGDRQIICGEIDGARWTLIGLDDCDRPVGAVAINNGRHISQLRRAMRLGQPVPVELMRDAASVPS